LTVLSEKRGAYTPFEQFVRRDERKRETEGK
jgi:hypothetical protein